MEINSNRNGAETEPEELNGKHEQPVILGIHEVNLSSSPSTIEFPVDNIENQINNEGMEVNTKDWRKELNGLITT